MPEVHREEGGATKKIKCSMAMRVIRANGEIEDHGTQYEQVIELDYAGAVERFGQERADEIFKGVTIDVEGVAGNGNTNS